MSSYNEFAGNFDWEQKTELEIANVRQIEMMVGNTAEILRDSTDLYENMVARAEAMEDLMSKSSGSESMLETLQLQSQMLGLVSATLNETQSLAVNRQQALAAEIELRETRERLATQQVAAANGLTEDEARRIMTEDYYESGERMDPVERIQFMVNWERDESGVYAQARERRARWTRAMENISGASDDERTVERYEKWGTE
jgi:hypothetical protein